MKFLSRQVCFSTLLLAVLAIPAWTQVSTGILHGNAMGNQHGGIQEGKPASPADQDDELKELYSASEDAVTIISVPEFRFAMIDGEGDPNTAPEFSQAVEALYTVSYTLKFMVMREKLGPNFQVMPLEGLWWTDDMHNFNIEDKGTWKWTVMIKQPDFVTEELFARAVEQARKVIDLPALDKIRLEKYHEGLSAQILHIGPYSEEAPTIEKLHNFIAENGYQLGGKHHEIYFNDPRQTKPEDLKTIIRQPVK